jgi:hypothetical protein
MRTTIVATLVLMWGCASAGGGGSSLPSGQVYLYERDIPCDFETVGPVRDRISVASLRDYERLRDQALLRGAERLGADAVLIPEDRPEPGRGRVGLSVRRTGGVNQFSDYDVEGVAIRLLMETCPDQAN